MVKSSAAEVDRRIAGMDAEQLPANRHLLHGPGHFAGLYASENVAGTEFVFGATFVILGAGIVDVLIGLAVALRGIAAPAEVKALVVACGAVVGSYALAWRGATPLLPLLYTHHLLGAPALRLMFGSTAVLTAAMVPGRKGSVVQEVFAQAA